MFSSVSEFVAFYSKRNFELTRQFSKDISHKPLQDCLSFYNYPQKKYKVLHIAGTSGKGSITLGMSKLLQRSNYNVGTFVSPHYISLHERILYNGEPISEEDILEQLKKIQAYFLFHKNPNLLSFFEILTFIAFSYFEKRKVDWAVIETGLGGRYDCTNNVNPEAVVLTPIGIDHTSILGKTINEIIYNKAGIIKYNTPVFSLQYKESIHQELQKYTKEKSAVYHDISLAIPAGTHFVITNAHACLYILKNLLPASILAQKFKLLSNTLHTWCHLRGRLEKILDTTKCMIIFDSAHNLIALKALCFAFSQELQNYENGHFKDNVLFCSPKALYSKHWKFYIGVLKDRNLAKFVLTLIKQFRQNELSKHVTLLSISIIQESNLPLYPVENLISLFSKIQNRYNILINVIELNDPNYSLDFKQNSINIICGSIYLYAPVKKHLQNML